MLKSVLFAGIAFISTHANAECMLEKEAIASNIAIGKLSLDSVKQGSIQLDESYGDISKSDTRFNLDTLYHISNNGEQWSFRIGEIYFLNGKTTFGSIQWEDGKHPNEPGTYDLYKVNVQTKKSTSRTLTTVGDSITWWSAGSSLRCLLSKNLQGLQFTGPHTDRYGYGHAGEGGNKTVDVLQRLDKIDKSDYYLLHIGTNDWPIGDAEFTFKNIVKIAKALSAKGGEVIILTILPRLDENDARNVAINQKIREWNGRSCNCRVIDLYTEFMNSGDLKSMYWDTGIHPNAKGYERIVEILSPQLERIIGENKASL